MSARHQSMHHFVANAPWDGAALLRVARDWCAVDGPTRPSRRMDRGRHRVSQEGLTLGRGPASTVALGKQDNCQVAVSVSLANDAVSLPVTYRLYLPESWAQDRRRRRAAGVPDAVEFEPKWQLALAQIRTLQAEGCRRRPSWRMRAAATPSFERP